VAFFFSDFQLKAELISNFKICETWAFHSGDAEDSSLLECDFLSLGEYCRMF